MSVQVSDADRAEVAGFVERARSAQREYGGWGQADVDDVVAGVAWAGYREDRAEELGRVAALDSGMGVAEDKREKIRRKTLGTLADLTGAVSVGVVSDDPVTGITEIAKPVGVVAALIPSTNPEATPINKAMMALKGRNAVVFSPSPKAARTCGKAVDYMRDELAKVGAPLDLVQVMSEPTKALSYELMAQCDLSVVTGSQRNVRAAYRSGKPAIGVGLGNATVVVDATADIADAAAKIRFSKTFDNATSCSSENALVVHEDVYADMVEALESEGGYVCSAAERDRLEAVMWVDGALNPEIIAQPAARIAELAGLGPDAADAAFFMVEGTGTGPDHPFSGEKLSVVLTLYRYGEFSDAIALVQDILAYQGIGHSCGIHTTDEAKARRLALEVDVARVLVNQAHAVGNGGAFDNGLNTTLTMGCGTWAGNAISENLSYRHFLNTTRLVRPIGGDAPAEESVFGGYWERYGR
ncbi:MAG: aldehyde dehydrogenase family protein [Acidimicrobiia bacterium]|nr:aldehyde dehydrogenase family protein [Acidimicrobiia bacterium]